MDGAIFYPIVGFIVGLIVGLTGVGGGSLMTPLLILGFGVPAAVGVGTDLVFATITKAAGVVVHRASGNIDWKVFRWLALGSLPSAFVVLALISAIGNQESLDRLIMPLLGVALLVTGAALILRPPTSETRSKAPFSGTTQKRLTILLGGVVGSLVTVTSVGAGAIGLAVLRTLYPGMRSATIVGTDIAHAIPLVAIAGLGHMQLGTVNYELLAGLLIGSVPGIWVGSILSSKLPETAMRRILACILVTVGVACIM